MKEKVTVDGRVITKSGQMVADTATLAVDETVPKYVCRAGFKLEKALDHFALDVTGKVVLDAGLSTGGFTDCLLQRGAKKIYGVDVGYGQVHENIRKDSRVVVLERTNLRYVETVGELVDVVTLDLSFISVLKVMEAVVKLMKPDAQLVVLIKPQFEATHAEVSKGEGVITDISIHERVVQEVTEGIVRYGFVCKGVIASPIAGGSGNKEFLGYFVRQTLTK